MDMNKVMDILRYWISEEEKVVNDFETGKAPASKENEAIYYISKEFLPQYEELLSEMEKEFSD